MPLLPPLIVATPEENVIGVFGDAEKLLNVPALSLTVGFWLSGAGETPAPKKLSVFEPVYPVAMLPDASRAVILRP
jgi:hypothetical protein